VSKKKPNHVFESKASFDLSKILDLIS